MQDAPSADAGLPGWLGIVLAVAAGVGTLITAVMPGIVARMSRKGSDGGVVALLDETLDDLRQVRAERDKLRIELDRARAEIRRLKGRG